ncbi:MAG: hypothetical protein ACREM3_00265 [Candidatus Rokuibacteriota bacterium]
MQDHVAELLSKELLPELCQPKGFQPIDPPAERHGSWEWVLHKRSQDVDRFVRVAFTGLPQTVPDGAWYAVEIWAGAEKGDRYRRNLVSDFRASGKKDHGHDLRSALREPLTRAMDIAESFKPADLTEAYLPSRARQ